MNSGDEKRLIMDLHQDTIGQAVTIRDLRRDLAEARSQAQEAVIKGAEAEVPLQALNEFTDYLMERTRAERAASGETGLWTKGAYGNSIALTLYQDLCSRLDLIRTSHGL